MNTFFYAPKDDPYHRMKWKIPYPDDKIREIKELIYACRDNYVDFVFSVSPGVEIIYSSDMDFDLLSRKFCDIMELGVRKVSLLLDDISWELKNEDDTRIFGRDLARAQAFLANKLYGFLRNKYGDITFIMCPTEYSGLKKTQYKDSIKNNLDKNIILIWTGIGVSSRAISCEDAEIEFDLYGHEMLLWDNFPVNDGSKQLKIGPVRNRSRYLYKHRHAGIVSNPMNEAETSKISLMTYADYCWNSGCYIPEYSIENALYSFDSMNTDILRTMYRNCQAPDMCNEYIPELEMLAQKCMYRNECEELIEYLRKIEDLYGNIDRFNNTRFVEEIKPWLNKMQLTVELGLSSIDIIKGIKRDDFEDILSRYRCDDYRFAGTAVLELAEYAKAKHMDIDHKLGQLFMVEVKKNEMEELVKAIDTHKIGNFIIREFYDNPDELKRNIEILRNRSDAPVFTAADHEGGNRCTIDTELSKMSSAMAVSAANHKGDGFNNAYMSAVEMKGLGINMVFAPVLNLAGFKDKTLGTRTFGEWADAGVIEGVLNGYKHSKMYACVKYFPVFNEGTGTLIIEDDMPVSQYDMFKMAMKKDVPAILVSNVIMKVLDKDNTVPCSQKVLNNLLRGRYGYKGLIFTDLPSGQESTVEFFEKSIYAGADLFIIHANPHDLGKIISEIKRNINDRLLKKIDISLARILKYKDMVEENNIDEGKLDFYKELSFQIAAHSITPIKVFNGNIEEKTPIALVVQDDIGEFGDLVEEQLSISGFTVITIKLRNLIVKEGIGQSYNYVFLTKGQNTYPDILYGCKSVLQFISGYPEHIMDFADGVYAIYDTTVNTAKAVTLIIEGKLAAEGKAPISINYPHMD